MAVSKFYYLDQAGVQALAQDIFGKVNTRISDRLIGYDAEGISAASFADDTRTLTAKALLSYLGDLADFDTLTGEEETLVGKMKAIQNNISALTHLTYQVVTGDIQTEVPMADAQDDVIYLQHDEPSIWVANDGYVMHDAIHRASALEQDGETPYYAFYDATADKYYKSDGTTVSSTELTSSDDIFDADNNVNAAALVEDTTYNLYIAQLTKDGSGDTTAVNWICVGDTNLELSNYWSKKDSDVVALRDLMFDEITSVNIASAVQTAYNATAPTLDPTT